MKIAVFVEYDGVGGSTYNYVPRDYADLGATAYEENLKRNGIEYDRQNYASVYDFLSNCEEVCSDSFTDGEALEYVLEVIRNLGV